MMPVLTALPLDLLLLDVDEETLRPEDDFCSSPGGAVNWCQKMFINYGLQIIKIVT